MKICVFTHTFPRYPGDPVAPFMLDFCVGLLHEGIAITLLAPYDPSFSLQDKKEKFTIKLYKYIYPNHFHMLGYSRTLIGDQKFKYYVYPLAPLMLIFSFFALLRVVQKEKIKAISAHWIVPNGFIAALVSKITGVPLIITVPGSDVYLAKKNAFFRSMTIFAAKQAKAITSNSMRYLDELSLLGIDKKKFQEIPYGININDFKSNNNYRKIIREELNISDSQKTILAVGRIVEKKGFMYLIKSLPLVIKENKNVVLIIIGDGDQKNQLIQTAENLGIADHLRFVSKVNHAELQKYYSAADIYVASSIIDSKGNFESHIVALFEAIASGLPVVATKLAVNATYVQDYKNGIRVDDKNEQALAQGINALLKSKNLKEMGKKSRDIAEKYLTFQASAKQYLSVLERVTSSTSQSKQ